MESVLQLVGIYKGKLEKERREKERETRVKRRERGERSTVSMHADVVDCCLLPPGHFNLCIKRLPLILSSLWPCGMLQFL